MCHNTSPLSTLNLSRFFEMTLSNLKRIIATCTIYTCHYLDTRIENIFVTLHCLLNWAIRWNNQFLLVQAGYLNIDLKLLCLILHRNLCNVWRLSDNPFFGNFVYSSVNVIGHNLEATCR